MAVNSFSYNDLAREHVRSAYSYNTSAAEKLAAIYEAFSTDEKIRAAAVAYCDAHNESLVEESDSEPLDVDDFKCAFDEEINEECETLLHDVEVDEDLADAKASIIANAAWKEYAADVMSAIRTVAEIDAESDSYLVLCETSHRTRYWRVVNDPETVACQEERKHVFGPVPATDNDDDVDALFELASESGIDRDDWE